MSGLAFAEVFDLGLAGELESFDELLLHPLVPGGEETSMEIDHFSHTEKRRQNLILGNISNPPLDLEG